MATLVGFSCGFGIMLVIRYFVEEEEDDDSDSDNEQDLDTDDDVESNQASYATFSADPKQRLLQGAKRSRAESAPARSNSKVEGSSKTGRRNRIQSKITRAMTSMTSTTKRPSDSSSINSAELISRTPSVPWGMVAAVFVDSFVDGLLIGIAFVINNRAGFIMTFATAVEMGFLGLSFSASLTNLERGRSFPLISIPPLIIILGGVAGSGGSAMLASNPVLFTGLIAFGAAALLYLVTQELLIEAHENEDGEVWWIDMWLFWGFLAVIMLESNYS